MDNRYKELGKNTALLTIGSFSSKLLTFVLTPLYTTYMTTSDYGLVDLISTTVYLIMPFLTLSASEGILRFTLDKKNDKKQVFSIPFWMLIIGFILLFFATAAAPDNIVFANHQVHFLLYYITYAFLMVLQQFVKGLNHVTTYTIAGITTTTVTCILNMILLTIFNMGADGYLISIIVANIFTISFLCIKEKLWKYILPIKNINKDIFKAMMLYCIPLIPNSLSWWISNSSDKYILSYFWGIAFTGVYAVAYKIPSIISVVSNILTSAWQISAVDGFESEDFPSFFSSLYKRYSAVYSIICSLIITVIKWLAVLLFAKDFFGAWKYALILVFAAIFQSKSGFIGVIYTTARKTTSIFLTTLLGAGSNVLMNFIFIPKFGAAGAAIATLLSYVIVWITRILGCRKIIKVDFGLLKETVVDSIIIVQCIIAYIEFENSLILNFICSMLIVILYRDIFVKSLCLIKNKYNNYILQNKRK